MPENLEHQRGKQTDYRSGEFLSAYRDQPSLAGVAGEILWPEDWNSEALLDRIKSERRY